MKIFLIAILYVISLNLAHLVYDMREVDKVRRNKIESLKDCRMSLHAYILRQRGEMKNPTNPDICHLDPLLKNCACEVSREKLAITDRKYSNGVWSITLNNDNISYEIPDLLWNLIQDQVPRFTETKQVIQ
jgi:hypothetical protein